MVFEGGLNWGSFENCGYCDIINLGKYLKAGENIIFLLCWYWGYEGRNNIDSKSAGLIFEADDIDLYSDETFMVLRHPAFIETNGEQPAYE